MKTTAGEESMRKLLSCCHFAIMMFILLVDSAQGAEEAGSDSLKILVYGATGKIGSHVVDEALNRGHLVTAVSRDPSRISKIHNNLLAVKGDILDLESISNLVVGQDIVIVSVRGIVGKSKNPNDAIQRIAAENVSRYCVTSPTMRRA